MGSRETPARSTRDPRKISVYLEPAMLEQMQREARRLDCSISHLLQRAWRIARRRLGAWPPPSD